VVRTWLEGDVQVGVASTIPGGVERNHLGMGLPWAFMPPLTHHLAVLHNDGADQRIRGDHASSSFGEVEGPTHEDVVHDILSGRRGTGR
jgi:hypothetical protein